MSVTWCWAASSKKLLGVEVTSGRELIWGGKSLHQGAEKEMATHSSILAQEIPWREEPGGLQSVGSQKSRHDLDTKPPPPLHQGAHRRKTPPPHTHPQALQRTDKMLRFTGEPIFGLPPHTGNKQPVGVKWQHCGDQWRGLLVYNQQSNKMRLASPFSTPKNQSKACWEVGDVCRARGSQTTLQNRGIVSTLGKL